MLATILNCLVKFVGFVDNISAIIERIMPFFKAKKKIITINEITKLYKSPSQNGNFTFDYSNNNGEYVIGDGETSFTTKWSKASNTSIHAYNDGEGITAIALQKGVEKIDSIENIEGDFSSRCRTAQIGDAIIWKNVNGRTAITKVISIKDDTRGDSQDELTCEYYIFK